MLINSLVDHVMNITIEENLESDKKTEVYNYLLKLLKRDAEGFQKTFTRLLYFFDTESV